MPKKEEVMSIEVDEVEEIVEDPEVPVSQNGGQQQGLSIDPLLILQFLQDRSRTDKELALQIEAATYRAGMETLQQQ